MKLIIDIDEELYKNVIEHTKEGYIGSDVWIAVAKGEPVSTEGDLISRKALKDDINSLYEYDTTYNEEFDAGVQSIINFIDNAPTVPQTIITEFKGCDNCELERPQGRWVFKDLHNGKTWYECSVCGRKIHIGDKVQKSDFPFCHCGADMRGEEK